MEQNTENLLEFISHSPTAFHAVGNLKKILESEGFTELCENAEWQMDAGGKYYVTRNQSALIAFRMPKKVEGFHIVASHSDSPTFKIKEIPELTVAGKYTKINVEGYGGMIMSTWLDRPLSVAGRILVRENGGIQTKLVNVDKDLFVIPSLAIHMNRSVNDGYTWNIQKDMLPLYGDDTLAGTFMKTVAESVGVEKEAILGHDLFLYPRIRGCVWGENQAYISSPRLDDLECVYTSVQGLLSAQTVGRVAVAAVLDNEEVGSSTKQGADSDFLKETVDRICDVYGMNANQKRMAMASSFMVSADNAHAAHPNAMDKADAKNRPFMNEGIVIKYNANQKYTSDGVSSALFKMICERAKVPYQTFANRSDMAGGSTLGNISNTHFSVNTVDIGLAQLAMHSVYETVGVKDAEYMCRALQAFYESAVVCVEDGTYVLK